MATTSYLGLTTLAMSDLISVDIPAITTDLGIIDSWASTINTTVVNMGTTVVNAYTPIGWNAAWVAAKAASSTTPAWVTQIGDSIGAGEGASNPNTTGYFNLLRTSILAQSGITLYGDFWATASNTPSSADAPPTLQTGSTVFSAMSGTPTTATVASGGYGNYTTNTNTSLAVLQTITAPYACTRIDLLYLDAVAGTWKYSVDGGALQTVTNTQTSVTEIVKRVSITGLSNATHTVTYGTQSAATTAVLLGVVFYASTSAGIGFCNNSFPGISAYQLAGENGPNDLAALWAGPQPQGNWSQTQTSGALTTGGAITSVGVVALTEPVPAGSITLLNGAHTQTFTNTAAAVAATSVTVSSQTPNFAYPAATVVYTGTAATGFGIPTQPALAIIELGANDCFQATAATATGDPLTALSMQGYMNRLINAFRRGYANCSIAFVIPFLGDNWQSDTAAGTKGHLWYYYRQAIWDIARANNCAVFDVHSRWGQYGGTNGFVNVTDQPHPSDAGHTDMANFISPYV